MIIITDIYKKVIGEFNVPAKRTWKMHDIGTATFSIVKPTYKQAEKLLNYGNGIYVYEEGILPWFGIMTPKRTWSSGSININANSIEWILSKRYMKDAYVKTGTVGELLIQLINYCNEVFPTGIVAGEIYEGGPDVLLDCTGQQVWRNIVKMVNLLQYRMEFETRIISGRAITFIHLREHLVALSDVVLETGVNIEKADYLAEDGDPVNYALGYGSGGTWSVKPKRTGMNTASLIKHGLFEEVFSSSGKTNADIDLDIVKTLTGGLSQKIFSLTINDDLERIFVGYTYKTIIHDVGMDNGRYGTEALCMITGMSKEVSKKFVEIACEEIVRI